MFHKADFILRLTDFQEWTPRVEEGTPCQLDTVCFGNSCWIACTVTDDNSDCSKSTKQVWVGLLYEQELKLPLWSLYMVWLSYLIPAALFFFLWSHFGHKQAHKFSKKTNLLELWEDQVTVHIDMYNKKSLFWARNNGAVLLTIPTTGREMLMKQQTCLPSCSRLKRLSQRTYNVWWGITNQAAAEQQNAACCNLSEPEWDVLIRISTMWPSVSGLWDWRFYFFFTYT